MGSINTLDLADDQPFSLDKTLTSGQVQRWYFKDGWWYGIVKGTIIKIRQKGKKLEFSNVDAKYIQNYFALDVNLNEIYDALSYDPILKTAIEQNRGLRIIRQDPWECLIFQMTVNKIRTRKVTDRISRISSKLGTEIKYEDETFYTFPRYDEILTAGLPALKACNISYFADNIYLAAKRIEENKSWVSEIESMPLEEAILYLKGFKGIKQMVAEWILLLSFCRYDAFPVDAHIRNFFKENYLAGHYFAAGDEDLLDIQIRDVAKEKFGKYCGYAFEYLFCMIYLK